MGNENIQVSDYGAFSDGVSSINTLNTDFASSKTAISDCQSTLDSDAVFMGPICDSCMDAFSAANSKINNITSDFSAVGDYLVDTANSYQEGDKAGSDAVLRIGANSKVETATVSNVSTGNASKDAVYNYLANKGFNNAAICGILANIEHESGFDPTALGDNGTSYGICQWHNSRWTNLKNYCAANNKDVNSLEGQLDYLVYELEHEYPGVYNTLKSVPNTEQGAYDAAYKWTVDFEIPDNSESRGIDRGNTAKSSYWNTYGAKSI